MAEEIVCRLCVHPCSEYRSLYDDVEVYGITVKYFDHMFLNLQQHLRVICTDCWYHIFGFHTFQQSVMLAQTKFVKDEPKADEPKTQLVKQQQDKEILEPVYNISDTSEFTTLSKVVVKEELMLTDVHSDSQCSSDDDRALYIAEIPEIEMTTGPMENKPLDGNILKESNKDDDEPKRKTTQRGGTAQKRKSIKQLDDLIAQWRPILNCLACPESFSRFTHLQTHFRQEHPKEEFYVLCCQTKFKRRYSIEEHVRFHINQNEFACPICGKSHTNKLNLSSHMSYWHGTKAGQQPPDVGSTAFTCDICGKTPSTAGALRKHKQRHKKQERMTAHKQPSSSVNTPECGQNDLNN